MYSCADIYIRMWGYVLWGALFPRVCMFQPVYTTHVSRSGIFVSAKMHKAPDWKPQVPSRSGWCIHVSSCKKVRPEVMSIVQVCDRPNHWMMRVHATHKDHANVKCSRARIMRVKCSHTCNTPMHTACVYIHVLINCKLQKEITEKETVAKKSKRPTPTFTHNREHKNHTWSGDVTCERKRGLHPHSRTIVSTKTTPDLMASAEKVVIRAYPTTVSTCIRSVCVYVYVLELAQMT
jgi:hypothetical protein